MIRTLLATHVPAAMLLPGSPVSTDKTPDNPSDRCLCEEAILLDLKERADVRSWLCPKHLVLSCPFIHPF
jgi:hypothetical protein